MIKCYWKIVNKTTFETIFTLNFNYNTTDNRLQSIDIGQTTYNFSYDAAGNQTKEGASRFFEWDHSNRLRCFYVDDGSTVIKYTHYLYDGAGNRVKKITMAQASACVRKIEMFF